VMYTDADSSAEQFILYKVLRQWLRGAAIYCGYCEFKKFS
jgi:hypothetical protein